MVSKDNNPEIHDGGVEYVTEETHYGSDEVSESDMSKRHMAHDGDMVSKDNIPEIHDGGVEYVTEETHYGSDEVSESDMSKRHMAHDGDMVSKDNIIKKSLNVVMSPLALTLGYNNDHEDLKDPEDLEEEPTEFDTSSFMLGWNGGWRDYALLLGIADHALIVISILLSSAKFVSKKAHDLCFRSRVIQRKVEAQFTQEQVEAGNIAWAQVGQLIKNAETLKRRALQHQVWSLLLYRCAQLTKPVTFPHAVRLLSKNGSNGSLAHQSSVCLWNAERVLQSLLLAHGNNLILNNTKQQVSRIHFHSPRSVKPSVVVPTAEAYKRMKLRVGYQLRRYVHKHYAGAVDDEAFKGEAFLKSQRDAWLDWVNVPEDDLLDYADNIESWEDKIGNVPIGQLEKKLKVKAAAHRYRNLYHCTVKYDPWMQKKQKDNVRQAELLNRETRAQFVYSVYLALALFYRITGVVLQDISIFDCKEYFEELPEVDDGEIFIKDKKPPDITETIRARDRSYLKNIKFNKEKIEALSETAFQKISDNTKGVYEDLDRWVKDFDEYVHDDKSQVAKEQVLERAKSRYGWNNWLLNHTYTELLEPPEPNLPPIGNRQNLSWYEKRFKNAAQLQLKVSEKYPLVSSMALSEICLVLSAGTG